MMKRGNLYLWLFIIFCIVFILAHFIHGSDEVTFKEQVQFVILIISTFLFGMFAAFSIANRKERLNIIRENLRKQDAMLMNILILSKSFGKSVEEKVRTKIDEFLTPQIDYKLEDFDKETPKNLKKLYYFMISLPANNNEQSESKSKILDDLAELLQVHRIVIYHISDEMLPFEWVTLVLLGLVMEFSMFYGNNNSISSMFIISILSVCLFLLLIILKQLDSLVWQEQRWIWNPLSELFDELGLLPYIPEDLIITQRIKLDELKYKKIRVASFSKPYPDFSGKKVKIMNIN